MTETTHQAWEWEKSRSSYKALSCGGEDILRADEYAGSAWIEISDEHAREIAATPELLRIAELVKEAAQHKADKDWTMFHLSFNEAAEAARAVLSRVEGKAA